MFKENMMAIDYSESVSHYFDILELVKSRFNIKDSYLREGLPTFTIIPDAQINDQIEWLRNKVYERGLDIVLQRNKEQIMIVVVPLKSKRQKRGYSTRLGLPLILFIATIATVSISGYLSARSHITLMTLLGRLDIPSLFELTLQYTLSVIGIVGFHELGHLIACRIHRVKASLPLFIPGIPGITPGTFGAVVQQESPAMDRNQLFDLGFMGPLFGLIIAVIVSIIGYSWSVPVTELEYMYIVDQLGPGQTIFPPIVFMFLGRFVFPDPNSFTHFLHPMASAGWIGTLITFFQVFPIGQLDGGHVSRALLGKKWHHRISYIMTGLMILAGWWEMALLTLFIIRTYHPGALNETAKVTLSRKIAGVLLIFIFIACFTFSSNSPLLMLLF